jgi:hypothetical protein
MYTTSSTPNRAKRTSVCSGGKSVRCNVLAARATTLDSGVPTNTAPGANATGAMVASAPSTTSSIPCCIGASDHCRTGFSPPFWCVSSVRPSALRERWGSISEPVIAGASGCAMRPYPTRCSVSETARSKPMTSITPPARKAKRKAVARSRWGAERVAVGRNASPAGATMTKTDPRSSRGSVGKGLSSSR